MPQHDFRAPRLYVDAPLAAGNGVVLDRDQANYLGNVLRLSSGAKILVFNGRDGEWQATLAGRKRADRAEIVSQTRPQDSLPDLHYVFAPLKHARLDYMAQKAVEMGASALRPVTTRHTQASRLNVERMRANVIEAAEQCGVLVIPEIPPETRLPQALDALPADRLVVFCDEDAPLADPVAALTAAPPARGVALVIGPEGGFDPAERDAILARPAICRLSLGPRILRADTAAVAALAVIQAVRGDWR